MPFTITVHLNFQNWYSNFEKVYRQSNQQTPNDRNSSHGLQLQQSKLKIDESGIKQSYSNQIHIKKKFYK
jgi:hypothetical protein